MYCNEKGHTDGQCCIEIHMFSFQRWTINVSLVLVWGASRRSVNEANVSHQLSNAQCLFPKQLNSDKHCQSNWHWIKRWVRCLYFQKASLKKVDTEAIMEDLLLDSCWFVLLWINVSRVLLKRRLRMSQRNCFSSQCWTTIAWSIDLKVHGVFSKMLKGGPVCF